jgi:DNA-binding CsgD family transcriptional regulator
MALHVRPIRIDELPRACALVERHGRGIHGEATLVELRRLWSELLNARRLEMHAFIDDALAPAQRIQGIASGVFASDAFADTLLAERTPMLARQVMHAELAGRSVILSRAQAALANGGAGLNAVELDFAFACDDWSVPAARRWVPPMLESLRLWLDGWRLRMGLRECIGRDLYLMVRSTGCLLQSHAQVDGQRQAPERQRYLMGMTRDQSRALPVAMASLLFFNERRPRFRFTMAQQDLLLLALGNHADNECAVQLHVSPHTVKLRWRTIFEQVAEERPDWFPLGDAPEGHRGVEKRRHLLAYLARHMEELRPLARPGRQRPTGVPSRPGDEPVH